MTCSDMAQWLNNFYSLSLVQQTQAQSAHFPRFSILDILCVLCDSVSHDHDCKLQT